ncbi:MAG: hypothetical protein ABIQ08_12925 [Duganella sp.]
MSRCLDKKIAVITSPANPVGHAVFMRTFSADVTLFERDDTVPLDAANIHSALPPHWRAPAGTAGGDVPANGASG